MEVAQVLDLVVGHLVVQVLVVVLQVVEVEEVVVVVGSKNFSFSYYFV
jgi:hypothetical protein